LIIIHTFLAIAVIILSFYRLLMSGVIPFTPSTVNKFNQFAPLSKFTVPVLPVLGAVTVYRGFRHAGTALRREIEETEHKKWFPRLLRYRKPVQVLLMGHRPASTVRLSDHHQTGKHRGLPLAGLSRPAGATFEP
jgi:hypothetical protein